MKYKKIETQIDITVKGIPNKSKDLELLYHYQGSASLETLEKLLVYLKEWYPKNKKHKVATLKDKGEKE